MRIAIANWSARQAGGAESYLELAIPALIRAGHEVAYLYEMEKPTERRPLRLPGCAPRWCVSSIGLDSALAGLRGWKPDIVYAHRLEDPAVERGSVAGAASVLYAHDYYGACISGGKTFRLPRYRPCSRKFGWPCLLEYYPRRCGGLSPVSMMRMFRLQGRRLAGMRGYDRIITASEHMRREYLRHGFAPDTVRSIMPPIMPDAPESEDDRIGYAPHTTAGWRLIFAGRMTHLKGGPLLIDALPRVSAALDAPVSLAMLGDGLARPEWEARAKRLLARNRNIRIEFAGWLTGSELASVARSSHLHVMPSIWPEPFGRSGPELGAMGLPTAAFAVGGIPEWLRDGANGFLAPGDPPTSGGLAEAIVRCLSDDATYARLRAGAIESARRFRLDAHIDELTGIFGEAAVRHGCGG